MQIDIISSFVIFTKIVILKVVFNYLCLSLSRALRVKVCIMAKPIAETPILYDEDAYRFEMAAHNVVPLPREVREQIRRNYEEVKKWCEIEVER